jgi:hypothetical protein
MPEVSEKTKSQVDKAFDLICRANSVTICSLDEMQSIVLRALSGEFDSILQSPVQKLS